MKSFIFALSVCAVFLLCPGSFLNAEDLSSDDSQEYMEEDGSITQDDDLGGGQYMNTDGSISEEDDLGGGQYMQEDGSIEQVDDLD
ncbi:MAG: hypothetical protein ABH883_02515 [Candidatus Omnitrophota bacterium]